MLAQVSCSVCIYPGIPRLHWFWLEEWAQAIVSVSFLFDLQIIVAKKTIFKNTHCGLAIYLCLIWCVFHFLCQGHSCECTDLMNQLHSDVKAALTHESQGCYRLGSSLQQPGLGPSLLQMETAFQEREFWHIGSFQVSSYITDLVSPLPKYGKLT